MPEPTPNLQTLDAHLNEGHLIANFNRKDTPLVQDALTKYGKRFGVTYTPPTGCGFEGGFYTRGAAHQPEEGVSRTNKIITCDNGQLTVIGYKQLLPEVQKAILQILKAGGFQLNKNIH